MRIWILYVFFISALFADKKDFVVIEKDQVVVDDFYAKGSVIEISGICKGDVYVAATQVLVDGLIEGDLICVSGSLQITGTVKGALRGLVGQTLIAGSIFKNTTLASAAFTSTPTAKFWGNVFLASNATDCGGYFARDLFVGASNCRFSGQVAENIHLYSGNIRINSKAQVGGYLEYNSPNLIDIQKGAQIKGQIIEKNGATSIYSKSMLYNNLLIGSKLAGILMNLFFTLLIGLILIRIWPNVFTRSLNNLKNHLTKCLGQGVLFIVVVPLLGLLLLITILGIPIAVTLIAFSVLGLYTAKIHTLYYLSERLKHKSFRKWGVGYVYSVLCVGYFLLQIIPYVSTGLSCLFTLAGLGASVYLPKSSQKI